MKAPPARGPWLRAGGCAWAGHGVRGNRPHFRRTFRLPDPQAEVHAGGSVWERVHAGHMQPHTHTFPSEGGSCRPVAASGFTRGRSAGASQGGRQLLGEGGGPLPGPGAPGRGLRAEGPPPPGPGRRLVADASDPLRFFLPGQVSEDLGGEKFCVDAGQAGAGSWLKYIRVACSCDDQNLTLCQVNEQVGRGSRPGPQLCRAWAPRWGAGVAWGKGPRTSDPTEAWKAEAKGPGSSPRPCPAWGWQLHTVGAGWQGAWHHLTGLHPGPRSVPPEAARPGSWRGRCGKQSSKRTGCPGGGREAGSGAVGWRVGSAWAVWPGPGEGSALTGRKAAAVPPP